MKKSGSKKYARESSKGCNFLKNKTAVAVNATLDRITNKCSEIGTDGEETQKQIDFTVLFTAF